MASTLDSAIAVVDTHACAHENVFNSACVDAAARALPATCVPTTSNTRVATETFGINVDDLSAIMRACRDIFIHASSSGLDGAALTQALIDAGSSATLASAFGASWSTHESSAMRAIRGESFGIAGQTMTDVQWELKVPITGVASSQEVLASIDLELSEPTPSGEPNRKFLQMEFNKTELVDFFGKIEKIQSQLDALM